MLVVVHASVLLVLGVALSAVVAVVHQHRVAQAAADLAGLAAARTVAEGGDGCGAAAAIARANRARLSGCVVRGRDVRVQVRVRAPGWPPGLPDLRARSRAGPVARAP